LGKKTANFKKGKRGEASVTESNGRFVERSRNIRAEAGKREKPKDK